MKQCLVFRISGEDRGCTLAYMIGLTYFSSFVKLNLHMRVRLIESCIFFSPAVDLNMCLLRSVSKGINGARGKDAPRRRSVLKKGAVSHSCALYLCSKNKHTTHTRCT